MVVQGLDLYASHSSEVTAALLDLAVLSQSGLSTVAETRSTTARMLLERLLILCTGEGEASLNTSRGAVLLTTHAMSAPEKSFIPPSPNIHPLRVLALHDMSEEEAWAILTAFPATEHQASTLALQSPDAVEATLAVTRPLTAGHEYCWVTYKLFLDDIKASTGKPAGSGSALMLPNGQPNGKKSLQVLIVLGWAGTGEKGCAPTAERACALLPQVAEAAGAVIANILLAERVRELETAATREALREVDRLKAELLGTVSHELRSPLAAIKGYAATLLRHERRLPRDERREFLMAINEASDRLEVIINRLLEMSQLETGTIKIERAPVDIVHLAREAISSLEQRIEQHHIGVPDRGFTFKLDLEDASGMPALTEPLVLADQRRLREVLDNLLENAIIYSPEGGTIRVTLRPVLQEQACGASQTSSGYCGCSHLAETFEPPQQCRHMLEICVADMGMGIPPEHLTRIFDRFHRVDTRLTREVSGLGLGLAICKRVVELHDGAIWAESEPGRGSKFFIWLPVEEEM